MQYQLSACRLSNQLLIYTNLLKKAFMDTMKLFMAIPDRINFLHWADMAVSQNRLIVTFLSMKLSIGLRSTALSSASISQAKRKAIAIDPSYIPKSGKKTPWIGYFWSGCAGEYKRGLEIMGISVIDIDNHECMTLGSIQTPDCKTLDNMDKNLVDWYSSYLISRKDKIQSISRTVVADAFFFKETFITPMCENDFHVISRFRNDVILYYPTLEQKTGKRGHPKWFDGRIDFANLDLTRCKEYKVNKGKLYGLRVYAKALKRYVSLAIWYPMDGRTDKWQLYFSTDDSMDGREVLDYYRTRFQLEFCFRDGKQHAGITNCQSTDFRKLDFHFNASLAAVNLAKAACKRLGIAYSISSCKSFIHNAYMLERFICVFGISPDPQVIDKLFKELILFTARAA